MVGATASDSIRGFTPTERIETVGDGAARIRGGMVIGGLFQVLGRQAAEGRLLTTADDEPGAAPVVALGAGLAQRLFGPGGPLGHSGTR